MSIPNISELFDAVKKHPLQTVNVIFLVIASAAIFWGINLLLTGNGRLSKLEAYYEGLSKQITNVEGDIDIQSGRISNMQGILSQANRKFAIEEIYFAPVVASVIKTEPEQTADSKWEFSITYADFISDQQATYLYRVDTFDQTQSINSLLDMMAYNLDQDATTFSALAEKTEQAKLDSTLPDRLADIIAGARSVPDNIDEENSFVLRSLPRASLDNYQLWNAAIVAADDTTNPWEPFFTGTIPITSPTSVTTSSLVFTGTTWITLMDDLHDSNDWP